MTNDELNKIAGVVGASFRKAIEPLVLHVKGLEEQLREAGAYNRALQDRVRALEQQK